MKGICLFGPSRALLAITSCLTSRAGKHLSGLLRLHLIPTIAFVAYEGNLFIGLIIRTVCCRKPPHVKSSVAYTRNLFLALVHSTMTRNHCVEPSYAWLVAIGCLISRAGEPHGSLFCFVFWKYIYLDTSFIIYEGNLSTRPSTRAPCSHILSYSESSTF